jgi:aspartate racemase
MKKIGLIGGMSWESSLEYYRLINEGVRAKMGGLHSAELVMVSIDFSPMEELQRQGLWTEAGAWLCDCAQALERAGAGCVVLCTNTMHKAADIIQSGTHIPLLHIADATARQIHRRGYQRVALLGTRFTMEEDFYVGRLVNHFGLEVLIPEQEEREMIHRVIYDELCLGITRDDSRSAYRATINGLVARGAQGIILGCTEIGLLVHPEDSPVPLFDTTRIHADAAVEWSLFDA